MTRISTPVQIPLPVQIVFEYVTTPGHWPEWHPSSLGVSGATDHSLEIGEQVTEEFLVAGRRGQAIWTVKERVVPSRWIIEGEVNGRKSGIVLYTLAPQGNGTSFQREFVYSMPNFLFSLLDRFVLRRRIEAESKQAVQQLRSALLRQQGNVAKGDRPIEGEKRHEQRQEHQLGTLAGPGCPWFRCRSYFRRRQARPGL